MRRAQGARRVSARPATCPSAGRTTFLTNLLYEGATGTRASTIKGASDIKPELATEIEGGFDATLLSSRMRFSATFYKKQITDLLLQAPIVPSTGFTTQYLNGGQITNRGTELELDVTPYQSGNRTWIAGVTFSQADRLRRQAAGGVAPFNPGVGSFSPRYGNAWIEAGQVHLDDPVHASAARSRCRRAAPARPRTASSASAGDANPDFNMGFSNQLAYRAGAPHRPAGMAQGWRRGQPDEQLLRLVRSRRGHGGVARAAQAVQCRAASVRRERRLREAARDHARATSCPNRLASTIFGGRAQAVRLELSGRNLMTWTDYTGLDPEVSNFGIAAARPLPGRHAVSAEPPASSSRSPPPSNRRVTSHMRKYLIALAGCPRAGGGLRGQTPSSARRTRRPLTRSPAI